MAGELAANSNRAARTLGDVLRRFTQARGRMCRGTLDFLKGVLTRKVHSTPITQQAEQSWLHTRRERNDVPVNFS
jgi:hypothetical protein